VSEWLWLILALAEPALLLAYFVLFLARKDVSIRPRAVAGIACVGAAAQLGFLAEQWPSISDAILPLLTRLIFVAALFSMRGVALVRARSDSMRAELAEACRRLFIESQEPRPGVLVLSARGIGVMLRLWKLGPLTLVLCPRPPVPGKLTLLFEWLGKRYPGPIPRIRVSLSRK
jgi:hypothetical protein